MQHRTAYLLLMLTTLAWGGNAIAGKLAVGHISPMLLTGARWIVALAILVAIGWPRVVADWPKIKPKLPLLVALGALGFTAFNVCLYGALVYTSAINASIEQAAIPMVIFLLNFLFFRIRVTWMQIAGFIVSVAGVLLVATHGEPARLLQLDVNVGDALVLVALLFYAIYSVCLRFKPDIHWQSMMIVMGAAAFVTSLPFVAAEAALGATVLPDATGWTIILFVAVFPSIVSQVLFMKGVELIGANRAGLFINLVPVFGTLLSIALLGEAFFAYHAMALALALGGIALAEASGRKQV
ncbi:MAG: DMT family transporter [Rhizobiaceae bacterium]